MGVLGASEDDMPILHTIVRRDNVSGSRCLDSGVQTSVSDPSCAVNVESQIRRGWHFVGCEEGGPRS